MNIDQKLVKIIYLLRNYLDTKKEILTCFCSHGVQLEGWFKGELLFFFSNLKSSKDILDIDREVKSPVANNKIDFKLELQTDNQSDTVWIELKHWLIGYQKGYKYNSQFYFGDPTSVGIKSDAEKLTNIKSNNKYMLIVTTANPGINDWYNGVQKFNNKFSNLKIESLTDPSEFNDFYFLGLLKILT